MSLPFFDVLQECFPKSTVDIIARESIQDVFLYHPVIRTIYPFSKSRVNGLFGLFRYGKSLQKQGQYDLFVTLAPSFSSALIGYGIGSPFRVGRKTGGRNLLLTHSFPKKSGIHQAQSYCQLLQNIQKCFEKIETTSIRPQEPLSSSLEYSQNTSSREIGFHFSAEEQQISFLCKQANMTYIVFNVNSEAQSRRLPLEKWSALGNRLLRDKTQRKKLVFTGTPAEQQRVAQVMQTIEPQEGLLDFSGKTSLRELAMLLRDADVVVSNDSGPMHLANAVGTPLVTFFGAGNPVKTEPFNKANVVVINKHLECSPCVKNLCRFPTVRCLTTITVDEIYHSVMKILDCRL